ncbi:hypothetical protein IWC96_12030 [Brevundimonas sp. BAL450]|jgi:hypothetical protein|nr:MULTISPECIES: hypothetical protein [Brevundimonas]MBG7615997.1 hypothetical protein [Brevundimonas sp. BAL450]
MKADAPWDRFLDLLFGKQKPGDPEPPPLPGPFLWVLRTMAFVTVVVGLLWLSTWFGFAASVPVIGSWGAAVGAERLLLATLVLALVNAIVRLGYERTRNRRQAATETSPE